MRPFYRLAIPVLLLVFSASAPCLAERLALLIGISHYDVASGLEPLPGNQNDIDALSSTLKSHKWDQIVTMTDESPARFSPTRDGILRSVGINIEGADVEIIPTAQIFSRNRLSSDDILLVYVSSHGITSPEGIEYFCPLDTKKGVRTNAWDVRSLVPLALFERGVRQTGAGTIIFALDYCQNVASAKGTEVVQTKGAIVGAVPSLAELPSVGRAGQKVAWLRACEKERVALPLKDGAGSVFTSYLVGALKGDGLPHADSVKDGAISLREWFSYAKGQTVAYVNREYPRRSQLPVLTVEENASGDGGWDKSLVVASFERSPDPVPCDRCRGTGKVVEEIIERTTRCSGCRGTGTIREKTEEKVECSECDGRGRIDKAVRCRGCGGRGVWYCIPCGGTGLVNNGFQAFFHAGCGGTGRLTCAPCGGGGTISSTDDCSDCRGRGWSIEPRFNEIDHELCSGTGRLESRRDVQKPCPDCDGQGVRLRLRK